MLRALLVAITFFLASGASPQASIERPDIQKPQPGEVRRLTIYVTKTGEKYHNDGCRYLRQSKLPMALDES